MINEEEERIIVLKILIDNLGILRLNLVQELNKLYNTRSLEQTIEKVNKG